MLKFFLLLLIIPLLLVVDVTMMLLNATKKLNKVLFTKAQENPH